MIESHHKDTGTASCEPKGLKSRWPRYIFAGIFVVIVQGLAFGQQESAKVVSTRQEVEALIKNAGTSTPQWWNSVGLNYPKTLDLNWPMKPGGKWNNQKNVGQYIWDVINPNPHRWKEGIRLVHHLMIQHKDEREKLRSSMTTLGAML